jgi:hypothetical protein
LGQAFKVLFAATVLNIGDLGMAQTLPKVSTGTLEWWQDFPSKFVAPRHVDVWLPPGYSVDSCYNVIYMHERHNEMAWAKRLEIPLEFMSGRGAP